MIDVPPSDTHLNRSAVISLIAAFSTMFSFCVAVAPIPFTGWVCYPSAAILGLVALASGIVSLLQIKARNEHGRALALVGIWVGGLAAAASTCTLTVGLLLFPRVVLLIHHYVKW